MENTQKIMKKFYDNLLDEISNSKEITTELLAKAQLIAKTINESDKGELIAKYDSYAVKLTELQTFIVKILEDGKIDDTEKAKIVDMLTPIATKITEAI